MRLDMSEFSEPHSVSRLIGAPPGYARKPSALSAVLDDNHIDATSRVRVALSVGLIAKAPRSFSSRGLALLITWAFGGGGGCGKPSSIAGSAMGSTRPRLTPCTSEGLGPLVIVGGRMAKRTPLLLACSRPQSLWLGERVASALETRLERREERGPRHPVLKRSDCSSLRPLMNEVGYDDPRSGQLTEAVRCGARKALWRPTELLK